jgi:N-terminal acetyltransferase B complex catalytic subunit
MPFYMQYLATWPEYFTVAEAPNGQCMAYIFGKAEGRGEHWHGHVTAVTVAPEFRRLGLAQQLMNSLESISEHFHNGYFVDLYVRMSNAVAIGMYKKLGYSIYRQVIGYCMFVLLPPDPCWFLVLSFSFDF